MKKIILSVKLPVILLVSLQILLGLGFYLYFLSNQITDCSQEFTQFIGHYGFISTFICLAVFGWSVLNMIIGIVILLKNKKEQTKRSDAKRLIIWGITGMLLAFTTFFLLSVILGFFGICITGSTLPRLQ
jgi:hypothetical protein